MRYLPLLLFVVIVLVLAITHPTIRCVAGHAEPDGISLPVVFEFRCDTVATFSRFGREVPRSRRWWGDAVDSLQQSLP